MSDGITDSMDVSLIQLWEMAKDREGRLACCSPWGHKESDTTEQLNNSKFYNERWKELIVLMSQLCSDQYGLE